MNTNVRQCRQCGEVRPIEQFRRYYGGRTGHYRICKTCERINSRAKYLEKKAHRTMDEDAELQQINMLYDAQTACGLQPPRRNSGRSTKLTEDLNKMIEGYAAQINRVDAIPSDLDLDLDAMPADIKKWFSADLTEEPDYYLDEVYEELKAKYRPVLHMDKATMLPVYDDTYKAHLDALLAIFNAYEDKYYES